MAEKPTYAQLEQKVLELEDRLVQVHWESIWDTFDQSPIPAFLIAKAGGIIRYNQAMAHFTGYVHDEVSQIEALLVKLYPDPRYRKQIAELTVQSRTRRKGLARSEATIMTKSLEARHVAFSVYDLKHQGRYLDLQVVQIEDLTERVNALESLQRLERIYSTSQKLAKAGGWEANVITHEAFWSEEIFNIFGLEPNQGELDLFESADQALALFHPEDRPAVEEAFRQCMEIGRPYNLEARIKKTNGDQAWIRAAAIPTFAEGKIVKVTGTVMDITELKEAYQALEESERNLNTILTHSQDGITRLDRRHRHIFANPVIYAETGLSPATYLGKTNEEIGFPDALCRHIRSNHDQVFASGKPLQWEMVFDGKLKGHQTVQVMTSPELNADGEVETIVDVLRDITALKKAEKEKDDLIARLQNAQTQIRTLKDILPICSNCNKIRDEEGHWNRLEKYFEERSRTKFSHALCPECARKLYPDHFKPAG